MPQPKGRAGWMLAAGTLAALTLLTGCQTVTLSDNGAKATYLMSDKQIVNDLDSSSKDGRYQASKEDAAILSTMDETLSNEHLALYLGKYYDVAVLDKDTGSVFFSNRSIYDDALDLSDEGKADAYSQIGIEYYDGASARNTMTSYPASVNDSGLDQVQKTVENNKLTLTYAFGTDTARQSVCYVMSSEGYDEMAKMAEKAETAETISSFQFARFQNLYQAVVYDELSDSDKATLRKKYPNLEKLGTIYVCDPSYLTSVQRTLMTEVSTALGINAAFIAKEEKKVGVTNSDTTAQAYFEIPVVYQLQQRDLIASVDLSKVVHVKNTGNYLTKIYLLSNFFATTSKQEGYLVVSDGSGAVIQNDSNVEKQSSLTMTDLPFYGSDFAVNQATAADVSPYSPFPVFGACSATRGVFGIVESGDALGGVRVKTEDSLSPFNTISPYFRYYTMDIASSDLLDKQENVVANRIYSKKKPTALCAVRYHFLYGDNASYSGMARYYRAYLTSTGTLQKLTDQSDLRLDISFLGAVTKRKLVGVIPMNVETATSTFAEIEAFGKQLAQKGVTHYSPLLLGAINGGVQFRIPHTMQVEKSMGGLDGLLALQKSLAAADNHAYLAVDFTRVYRNGNGLNSSTEISRFISNETAVLSNYYPSSGNRDVRDSAYLINPLSYASTVSRFEAAAKKSGVNNLLVSSMGSYLSANYDERHELTREESKNIAAATLANMKKNGYNLILDGCNTYALGSAQAVTDVPLESSGLSMESESIPFVGMVLHGYLEFSGVAINQQGSAQMALLKSIESGAGLHYVLMTQDPLLLADTSYSNYYSVSADNWKEKIISTYQALNQQCRNLSNSAIYEHQRLDGNVVRVTYENGSKIWINYSNTAVTVEGHTIQAMDYFVLHQAQGKGE